ncbi:NADAR family protein [Candidatus Protochlamydia phocaeensis]|uniref:NADAR family protein n=1 Tax=Candidatus Protochlamydia phocaeensis TaxID=1414722 RepID=UPI00083877F9|nr:NADAR family protein [Candidatus Protochlamydia phocaeensis]
MLKKQLLYMGMGLMALSLLSSWNLPAAVSRQYTVQPYNEDTLNELKSKAEKKKQKQKQAARDKLDRARFAHLAHYKNKLARFAERDGFIWFYDKENKYTFFLGNFYPASVKLWNMEFSCSEAAFQAAKFLHKPALAARFTRLNGEDAWKLAQRHSYEQRDDWYKLRDAIMLEVLRAKFQQHPQLNELLLATGDAYLVEHTDRDAYWADGGDGKGKNRLGQLLMQVRAEKGGVGPVSKPSKYRKFAAE